MPQNQLRIPTVKSREVDSNADSLNDEILIGKQKKFKIYETKNGEKK